LLASKSDLMAEVLKMFSRLPQTKQIYFGGEYDSILVHEFVHEYTAKGIFFASGGHDGGYASVLRSLETEGFLNKLTVLKSYPRMAHDVEDLNLPSLTIEGLFMDRRLPSAVLRRPGDRETNPSPSPRTMTPELDDDPPAPPKVLGARKVDYSKVRLSFGGSLILPSISR
jgi:hypothetical protein